MHLEEYNQETWEPYDIKWRQWQRRNALFSLLGLDGCYSESLKTPKKRTIH